MKLFNLEVDMSEIKKRCATVGCGKIAANGFGGCCIKCARRKGSTKLAGKRCITKGCHKLQQDGFDGHCISCGRKMGIKTFVGKHCRKSGCEKRGQEHNDGYCSGHGKNKFDIKDCLTLGCGGIALSEFKPQVCLECAEAMGLLRVAS